MTERTNSHGNLISARPLDAAELAYLCEALECDLVEEAAAEALAIITDDYDEDVPDEMLPASNWIYEMVEGDGGRWVFFSYRHRYTSQVLVIDVSLDEFEYGAEVQ